LKTGQISLLTLNDMYSPRQLKRKKLFLIILVSAVVILSAVFFGYKILTENRISRFNVETENLNCTTTAEIEGILKSLNLNYFSFKPETVENQLRKKFICIGKIEQVISYPDRLSLKVTGREGKFIVTSIDPHIETNPQIILSLEQLNATQSTTAAFPPKVLNQILNSYKNASESASFIADSEGMVFEAASPEVFLPKLSIFSEQLQIGRQVPGDAVKKSAGIIEKLGDSGLALDNLLIVGEKLIIDADPRITFSLNRPIDRQAASLQLILRQAKMNLDPESADTRSVESVDLRFDRPVVVYSSKKK
jgi:hypothetical protein